VNARLLPEAVDELAAAIAWHQSQQDGLGPRFETAFWEAVRSLQQAPHAAALVTRNARRRRLRRFPWGIVYTIRHDDILIVAVTHLHRRPGYWRGRLSEN